MKKTDYKQKVSQTKRMISSELASTADLVIPLHLLYKTMMQEVTQTLEKKFELSKSELDLLITLIAEKEESDSIAPTRLYESLVFSSGGMTKLLKKLEQKSYITRVDNPDDKRSKLVRITRKGQDVAQIAINNVIKLESQYFSSLTEEEKRTLFVLFDKLACNLND